MRNTAFLVDRFENAINEAQDLVSLAESSTTFTHTNRLYVYEASYLLIFSAWEGFLEEAMIRFIAGYVNSSGLIPLKLGKTRSPDLTSAKLALFNGKSYLLWHSPDKPINRSKQWFMNGPHETVISSAQTNIEHFAAIRHYVAHRSSDCAAKFEAAAIALSGSIVVGRRAGRFLRRSTVSGGVAMRWIDRIGSELLGYAKQIAN